MGLVDLVLIDKSAASQPARASDASAVPPI